jgi:hypothetical protein
MLLEMMVPKMSIGPDGTGIPNQLAFWFSYNDADFTNGVVHPTAGFCAASMREHRR